MTGGFSAAERRWLAADLVAGREPSCPACGARLSASPVERPREVSYVRRRVLLTCPECRRTGAVDLPRSPVSGDGPP